MESNVEKISLDVNKLIISNNEDAKESELNEPCEQPIATNVEDGPENLAKSENQLLDPSATWESLGVPENLRKGLIEMEFSKPSIIQATTYPIIMKKPACHVVAQSHNGSGKTGAFGIATLSKIDESDPSIQAVIFAHTRELVNQIAEVLTKIAKHTKITISTIDKTTKTHVSAHVMVTTPGGFDAVFFGKKGGNLNFDKLKVLVIDEADYMITNDVTGNICEKTFKHFNNKNIPVQVIFFSATFTKENFSLIKKYYKKAYMIEIAKEALTLKNVRQMYYVCKRAEDKVKFIEEYLKLNMDAERVIIFVNTRDYVVNLQKTLVEKGYKVFILMGGDMDPAERDLTIKKFNQGQIKILITTNVLSRGFDEKLVQLVINFDMPVIHQSKQPDMENYLHRIGRTGRFGSKGIGLSLVSSDSDIKMIKDIEDFYKSNIEEIKSLDDLWKEFKKMLEEKLK